jgi:hypothetical protein
MKTMDSPILPILPKLQSDVEGLQRVLRREPCNRVPLIELAIAEEILAALYGKPLIPVARQDGPPRYRSAMRQRLLLGRALGCDYYPVRAEIHFQRETLAARNTATLASSDRQWVTMYMRVSLILVRVQVETNYPGPGADTPHPIAIRSQPWQARF